MRTFATIAEIRSAIRQMRYEAGPDRKVALVPTMGALHAGHLSLVEAARNTGSILVVSLFVNPLQFAPSEDLARYPRTFDDDSRQLEAAGVDLLFPPSPDEMTPPTVTTFVEVSGIGDRLDGASRPGHFRGVATIVAKLFNIIQPDIAFFGQKDAAQVAVLRAMVRDLNLPVRLEILPIVRDPDGLALSSRNRYLSPAERAEALTLSRALLVAAELAAAGEHDPAAIERSLRETLTANPALRLDYAAVVHPETLLPVQDLRAGALVAVAASIGGTRLIDNLLLSPAPPETRPDGRSESKSETRSETRPDTRTEAPHD